MKTPPTVHDLRKREFKVKVSHYRLFYKFCQWTGRRLEIIAYGTKFTNEQGWWLLDQYGGRTDVVLTDKQDNHYIGSVSCSKKDRYVKAFGLKKALLRAYSQFTTENRNFN